MRIVTHRHRQSDTVAQHGSQWYHTPPGNVHRILDAARQEISTGRTDTYRANFLVAAILLGYRDDTLAERLDEVVQQRIVFRIEEFLGNDGASYVDNGYRHLLHTDVNTYYSCLDCCTHGFSHLLEQ